jgi:hypothetical protein
MRYGLRATENSDTNVYDASGNVVPEDAGTTYGTVSGGTYPQVPFSVSPLSWANQNSTMLMIGAAALVGLILVAKAGR